MLATYPLDLVRTRMAADTTKDRRPDHRGMVDVVRAVVRAEGTAGLYRGLGISLVEIAPYTAISFGGVALLPCVCLAPAIERTRQLDGPGEPN